MDQVRVERLDHLGLIAAVIKDIRLIDMVDTRLVPDRQEMVTPGEAVAAMILNGLGFANRPLSLTPQFFANKPLDLLFGQGVEAEMFNRFKLAAPSMKPLPMAATCYFRNWPLRSVPKKALICASIISTRRAFPSPATTPLTATSMPFALPTATPKTTGRTSSKRCWN